jgi:hypothetical protein
MSGQIDPLHLHAMSVTPQAFLLRLLRTSIYRDVYYDRTLANFNAIVVH